MLHTQHQQRHACGAEYGPFGSGSVILRREVYHGRPWLVWPARVVVDEPTLLALFWDTGTPFGFLPHPNGRHPWAAQQGWQGHGVVSLQRPGEAYAVWVFWAGKSRAFAGWYINLQRPFTRRSGLIDTRDDELDILVGADGNWRFKDRELVYQRAREGRWSRAEADEILANGDHVAMLLRRGEQWWDDTWMTWAPQPSWPLPDLPLGWASIA